MFILYFVHLLMCRRWDTLVSSSVWDLRRSHDPCKHEIFGFFVFNTEVSEILPKIDFMLSYDYWLQVQIQRLLAGMKSNIPHDVFISV